MGYRISYGPRRGINWRWGAAGLCLGLVFWCAAEMGPVWRHAAAGEGLYDALARYVGEMIRNAR